MKADSITGAMAAEELLAKEQSGELDAAIGDLPPEMQQEAMRNKAILGDLAGLPPGHPLLAALEEARVRYESENQPQESEQETDRTEVRRAKRLDERRAKAEQRRRDDENNSRKQASAKSFNSSLSEAIEALTRLRNNAASAREDMAGDAYAQMKLTRLDRMLVAIERGLHESRLSTGRLNDG